MRTVWLMIVLTLSGSALAAPKVGSPGKTGSVLVFPYVVLQSAAQGKTTLIRLANDGRERIDVRCEYRDNNPAFRVGFVVRMKAGQAFLFDASGGGVNTPSIPEFPTGGDGTGLLVCWAIDPGGTSQIRWNHLDGVANIVDFSTGSAFEYKAWAFQVRASVEEKEPVGMPGVIKLDGVDYDACPQFLHGIDHNNSVAPGGSAHFVMTPCVFDVRQNYEPFSAIIRKRLWDSAGNPVDDSSFLADFWQDIDDGPGGPVSFTINSVTRCFDGILTSQCGLIGVQYRPLSSPDSGTGLSASGERSGIILWDPHGRPRRKRSELGPNPVSSLADTSQLGTVLGFPFVVAKGGAATTIIRLTNTNPASREVRCQYLDDMGTTASVTNSVPGNAAWIFNVSNEFPTGGQGLMFCWAVSGDNVVRWNYLSGSATIIHGGTTGPKWEYSAWSFAAHAGVDGAMVPGTPPRQIPLDGVRFDACGQYLLGQYSPTPTTVVNSNTGNTIGFGGGRFAAVQCNVDFGIASILTPPQTAIGLTLLNEKGRATTGVNETCLGTWLDAALPTLAQSGTTGAVAYRVKSVGRASGCAKLPALGLIGVQVSDVNANALPPDKQGASLTIVGKRSGLIKW